MADHPFERIGQVHRQQQSVIEHLRLQLAQEQRKVAQLIEGERRLTQVVEELKQKLADAEVMRLAHSGMPEDPR